MSIRVLRNSFLLAPENHQSPCQLTGCLMSHGETTAQPHAVCPMADRSRGTLLVQFGRTQVDLFGSTQSVGQLSLLSYSNLQAYSGEIFGRVEHQSGFFIKGFGGGASSQVETSVMKISSRLRSRIPARTTNQA